MVRIPRCIKLLPAPQNLVKNPQRNLSRYLDKDRSSKAIRQRFLDHFINDHNHNLVRSSPVVPYCDPTVAFVNAGMNQFKGIFLGTQTPKYTRVANSQKCVRVGGKHNDLNIVGLDGYHHTFFEMLGNWSFSDYFKKEACGMAWDLLTQRYKIDKRILYVTYFGGDSSLGVEPDLECKEIWRSLGVPEERILPFGIKDNFWEMGATGPCGPCTEIHVDLLGHADRAKFVNKGLHDLTELWNIVFIQYNRSLDGTIQPLPQNHIDTGMGFERLTALLQGKISNYDTDLFTNIFCGIRKICRGVPSYGGKFGEKDWNQLDTNFRILADHARMIVVCLADGVIPEQNQKLRRVIRKTFQIGETAFRKEMGLLKELSNYVVESLGPVYPELERNIQQIHQIIEYEEEVYRSIRANSVAEWGKLVQEQPKLSSLDIIEMPGLVAAYKEIRALPTNKISPTFGFKLYDTYGLDEETIVKVAHTLSLQFDVDGFRGELENAKSRSREQTVLSDDKIYEQLLNSKVKLTEDYHKYHYKNRNKDYAFDLLPVKLLKIVRDNTLTADVEPGVECSVILDKSNFYTESGGQVSDRGRVDFGSSSFEIDTTQNINGYILHKGVLYASNRQPVRVSARGELAIDEKSRLNTMRNHTATHLLNSLLKQMKGATCQKSSKVTPDYLNFDVGIFGSKLTVDEIKTIERQVSGIIASGVDVVTTEINSQVLLDANNVTLLPGEIYPDTGIRLVEITGCDFHSREPCCGTHVLNTADIEDFCIIGFRSLGRSTTSLHAVTGERARLARKNGSELLESVAALQKSVNDNIDKPEILDMAVTNLKQSLKFDMDGVGILPVVVKHHCLETLNSISKQIKDIAKGTLREFIEMEMQNVLNLNLNKAKGHKKYIVHYLACSTMLETVPLQKATKLCQDSVPVILIAYSDSVVKARCCVPKHLKNEKFDATKWLLSTVATIFKSSASVPKGQDATLVCNMKSKKINIKDWDTLLKQSIDAAKNYAEQHIE